MGNKVRFYINSLFSIFFFSLFRSDLRINLPLSPSPRLTASVNACVLLVAGQDPPGVRRRDQEAEGDDREAREPHQGPGGGDGREQGHQRRRGRRRRRRPQRPADARLRRGITNSETLRISSNCSN